MTPIQAWDAYWAKRKGEPALWKEGAKLRQPWRRFDDTPDKDVEYVCKSGVLESNPTGNPDTKYLFLDEEGQKLWLAREAYLKTKADGRERLQQAREATMYGATAKPQPPKPQPPMLPDEDEAEL